MIFWLSAIISTIAYAFQETLISHYGRQMNSFSVATYRCLSLGITMSPLLFFAPRVDLQEVINLLPEIFGACLAGIIASGMAFWSIKFNPIGISATLRRISASTFAIILGYIFLSEKITLYQLFFVSLLFLLSFLLSRQINKFPHIKFKKWNIGISLSIFSSVFYSISIFFFTKLSRSLNPFLASYIWEAGIGIMGFALILAYNLFSETRIKRISLKYFGKILLMSSPTVIGTVGFSFAVQSLNFGIVSSIGTTGIVFTMILAHVLFKERLSITQWILCLMLIGTLLGLKYSTN